MKIGIIGAGTMGNGIAHVCAINQNDVVLVDLKKSFLDRAITQIKTNLDRQLAKGIINSQLMSLAIDNIQLSTEISDLKDCDLIIEAVKEDVRVKSKIFKELDNLCDSKTILASNTSSISINQLSNSTKRPEKFIGMHFMNPVPVMKLVEIIKGDHTSKETLETIKNLAKKMNKIPIECNDSPGFVSNRILMPLINEAAYCFMDNIADKNSIDGIMELGMGHPMGPLKLADLIGIDVCVSIMKVLQDGLNSDKYAPCPLLLDMVKSNKLGKKTKQGFYRY